MSTISASDVKKLRDITGAGMMDCKKALTESNGDMDAAIDFLRKKGAKVAELRAGREANEGCISIQLSGDNKFGVMLQMACETDFVSKNESFIEFTTGVTKFALDNKFKSINEILEASMDGVLVKERISEKVVTIGEIISIKSYDFIEGEFVGFYNHNNRAGAIIAFDKADSSLAELGKDLCMQITAMKPVAVDESKVSADLIEREKAIAVDKAKEEGKPDNILEKIAEGAVKKFFKEFTLVNQEYIKDPKKTIAQVIKEANSSVNVLGFKRAELG